MSGFEDEIELINAIRAELERRVATPLGDTDGPPIIALPAAQGCRLEAMGRTRGRPLLGRHASFDDDDGHDLATQ